MRGTSRRRCWPQVALTVAVVLTAAVGCGRHPFAITADKTATADVTRQLVIDGQTRDYLVHQPAGTASMTGLPVVLAFHGSFGTDSGMASLTHLDQVADEHKFVVVYPQGYQRSWNDGRGNSPAAQAGIDDVAFVQALIAVLVSRDHVAARRIYATGISNGGMFTELAGCRLASELAGIAPVAGPMPTPDAGDCRPARPVPVMLIDGTSDPIVPYAGGHVNGRDGGGYVLSPLATAAQWQAMNGCSAATTSRALPSQVNDGTSVTITSPTHCPRTAAVILYTVTGGGHTWPGGVQYLPAVLIGHTSRQFDASELIWQFFSTS